MKAAKFVYSVLVMLSWLCCVSITHASNPGKPVTPFRIAGNLYYIGNSYVASYLIVTSQGNILINSDFPSDVPMLKANIEKLGFKYSDIKVLLINHAHADHSGGSAQIKAETGAKYMVMREDVPVVESGGKADFQYGNSQDPENFYPPVSVDRILHDGDKVKLGNAELTAHLSAGHTKGCTTWTLTVDENGKSYNVVILGGPYVNPGYRLVNNPSYPGIAEDYKRQFEMLKALPCDIFLGAHGSYFNLDKKMALMTQGKKNPFVDTKGFRDFVALKEQDFNTELEKQKSDSRDTTV